MYFIKLHLICWSYLQKKPNCQYNLFNVALGSSLETCHNQTKSFFKKSPPYIVIKTLFPHSIGKHCEYFFSFTFIVIKRQHNDFLLHLNSLNCKTDIQKEI